jgi:hypothetical protein
LIGSGMISSFGSLSGEARIASGASTISLLTSGLTTAAGGLRAEARRLGGGASLVVGASAAIAAADCLRFAAGIVKSALWTRCVKRGLVDDGLDGR